MPRTHTAFIAASNECGGDTELTPGIGDNSKGCTESDNFGLLAERSGLEIEHIRQQMMSGRGDLGMLTFVV